MVNGKWLKGFLFYFSTSCCFFMWIRFMRHKAKTYWDSQTDQLEMNDWNGWRQTSWAVRSRTLPTVPWHIAITDAKYFNCSYAKGGPKADTYSGLFFFCWESLLALSKCVKGCHDDKNVLAAIYLCRFRFAWFRFIRFYLGKRLAELSHVPCVRPFDMRFGHAPFADGGSRVGETVGDRERVRDWVGVRRELSCA